MLQHTSTIIMAAGKGKRMNNPNKSKVMYELHGKPLIHYVIKLSLKINSEIIVPVVGHEKNSVMEYIRNTFINEIGKIKFAHQDVQLGTGHAVMMAREYFSNYEGDILILSGDVPLLRYETVSAFINFHNENQNDASLISAVFENPFGYGRILRDGNGNFFDIREEKDCTPEEKMCREINSGIYLIKSKMLFDSLTNLKTDNAQGEYYLTDVFRIYRDSGKKTGAFTVRNNIEIAGINTAEQLKLLEKESLSLK